MFAIHLSSNQAVLNLGRVASVLISVDTDELPTCVADVLHEFLVHYDIHGGMAI